MSETSAAAAGCIARVDLGAIEANFCTAEALAGDREVIAVVKADAYGHGAVRVSERLVRAGCSRLAVLDVAEGALLRDAGLKVPVLLLSGVATEEEAAEAVGRDLTPVVHHDRTLSLVVDAARAAGARVGVHIEVDTGMRRMGADSASGEALRLVEAARSSQAVDLEGVFTHFARADEPALAPSIDQLDEFIAFLKSVQERGPQPGLIHADNSAALLAGSALAAKLPMATAVRPGLMLYGVTPAPHLDPDSRLRAVMSLRTRVARVHDVPVGGGVGYGSTFRAKSATRVATLRAGYADGVPRAAANRGHVWLAGSRRAIVGQVSMDYIGVDVGDARVEVGDEAILFGPTDGGGEGVPVEEAASAAGTIAYELLVRVGARVARQWVE